LNGGDLPDCEAIGHQAEVSRLILGKGLAGWSNSRSFKYLENTEIRSNKKLSLICSLLTQKWIFNQLGNSKYGSERSTKLQVKLARTEAHCIDTEIPISPTNYATPQVSDATRACIYTPDGKCVSMWYAEY